MDIDNEMESLPLVEVGFLVAIFVFHKLCAPIGYLDRGPPKLRVQGYTLGK